MVHPSRVEAVFGKLCRTIPTTSCVTHVPMRGAPLMSTQSPYARRIFREGMAKIVSGWALEIAAKSS